MHHEFNVTVFGDTAPELDEQATEAADRFYGPGNWRQTNPAFVSADENGYLGEYYFTDEPDEDTLGRTW